MQKRLVQLSTAALLAGLCFLGQWLAIPLWPVAITLQTVVVLLTGLLLPPGTAALAMLVHALLKLLVFGPAVILTPSFGFVLAFIPAAAFLAYLVRGRRFTWPRLVLPIALTSLLLYLIGVPYMALILNLYLGKGLSAWAILVKGCLLFIPGDVLKAALAIVLALRLEPLLRRA